MASAPFKAWAYASGLIRMGTRVPAGALLIAAGPEKRLRAAINALARHGRGSDALLVPGVPEAPNQETGLRALHRFIAEVTARESRFTTAVGVDLEFVRARMANPFVCARVDGLLIAPHDAASRVKLAKEFDEYECHAARGLSYLQFSVVRAIDVRFRKLMRGYGRTQQ